MYREPRTFDTWKSRPNNAFFNACLNREILCPRRNRAVSLVHLRRRYGQGASHDRCTAAFLLVGFSQRQKETTDTFPVEQRLYDRIWRAHLVLQLVRRNHQQLIRY